MASERDRLEELAALPLFAGCTKRELRKIAETASEVRFGVGQEIMSEGRVGTEAYVILDGEIETSVAGRVTGAVHPGEVLGEMSLVDHKPRAATAKAVTPVRAYALHARELQALIEKKPVLQRTLLQMMSKRLRTAT
jgi:CRP/FNR family transcriptional regulator, cyclic AMP receptor protein